jgi:hypothetical protein
MSYPQTELLPLPTPQLSSEKIWDESRGRRKEIRICSCRRRYPKRWMDLETHDRVHGSLECYVLCEWVGCTSGLDFEAVFWTPRKARLNLSWSIQHLNFCLGYYGFVNWVVSLRLWRQMCSYHMCPEWVQSRISTTYLLWHIFSSCTKNVILESDKNEF